MASTTTIYPNTLEGVKAFCKGRKALDLVRSFSTTPIPGAPAKWDDTLGICLDLEWYNQPPDKPMEIINEGGLVVFPMKKLRGCKSPNDFEDLIRNFAVHHLRIVETCHMRNKGKDKFGIPFGDTELNPRFCQTRFVTKSEAQAVLVQFLDNQRCDDGSKRPVIFFGQTAPSPAVPSTIYGPILLRRRRLSRLRRGALLSSVGTAKRQTCMTPTHAL